MNLPLLTALAFLAATIPSALADPAPLAPGVTRIPVVFSGGHETEGPDRGRPVILIASALGVPPEVFREAFTHVHPADQNVGPTGDEARQNKRALLDALGKYGVTNDRLDEVSNYYRYVRSRDQLWTNKPATADALVKDGAVIGYQIIEGGSGYSSPPDMTVPGISTATAKVELSFSQDLAHNGSVSAIQPVLSQAN